MKPRFHKYKKKLKKGPLGFNLCRGGCKREVKPPKRTFCDEPECLDRYLIRSNVGYMRGKLFERDKGVCEKCKFDAHTARKNMGPKKMNLSEYRDRAKNLISKGFPNRPNRTWWEADHVIPVCEGGGLCGLENLRTLCVPCHREETKLLRKRRADEERNTKAITPPPDLSSL